MANIPTAEEISQNANLSGKVAIVTGANSGIGKETARVLALRNAHVILAVRSVEAGNKAKADMLESIGKDKAGLLEVQHLDLASLASVRDFASRFSKREKKDLHFLINNAGLSQTGSDITHRQVTEDGLELTIGVNYVGPFLLTMLLLPFLKASAPARIINVASAAFFGEPAPDLSDFNLAKLDPFDPMKAYSMSKLCIILFSNELGRRLAGTGISANSLQPGLVQTNILKNTPEKVTELVNYYSTAFNLAILSIPQGAATTLYMVISEDGAKSGGYYHGTEQLPQSAVSLDEQVAKAVWEFTEKLTNVSFSDF